MALTKIGLTQKGFNTAMNKSADDYNMDVVKHLALVVNNGTLEHIEKEDRLKRIIDAVYVDGWNHGYGRIQKEFRENQMNLSGIARGQQV